MAIIIKRTPNQTSTFEIEKKTIKELAGLKFVGSGAGNIVENHSENIIKILQNFADDLPPTDPILGQLWYDTKSGTLKLFHGDGWLDLSPVKMKDEFKLKKNNELLEPSFDIINNSFYVIRNGLYLSSFEYEQHNNSISIPKSKKGDIVIICN